MTQIRNESVSSVVIFLVFPLMQVLALAKPVLEPDHRSILQRYGVDVCEAGVQILSTDVEDPLLAIPAEGCVRIAGVNDVLDRGCGRDCDCVAAVAGAQ